MSSVELELLLAEIARLLNEGGKEKARDLLERTIEELCEIEDIYDKISLAIEILNLISKLEEPNEKLLISIKFCIPKPELADNEYKLMYARFLAYYASVAVDLGLNPIEELEESDRILYDLSTDRSYLKHYASFINLFYVPIYMKIGKFRRALKSLDFVIDELEGIYNREKDESLLPILGETKAYKAQLMLELGEIDECLRLIKEAKSIFSSLKGDYSDYIEFLNKLEEEVKKRSS